MDDLRQIFAENLIRLRTAAGLKQSELGEKLNYSDKSVSKWERAEALPDVYVMKNLSDIFGVSVDDLLRTHSAEEASAGTYVEAASAGNTGSTVHGTNYRAITAVSLVGLWTVSLLAFVILWMTLERLVWLVLLATVPATLILLLVLNSVWNCGTRNGWIIGGLVLSVFVLGYYIFRSQRPWQIFLVVPPALLIVYISMRIRKKK